MTKEDLILKYEGKKKWYYDYWRKMYHNLFEEEQRYNRRQIEIFSEIIKDLKNLTAETVKRKKECDYYQLCDSGELENCALPYRTDLHCCK